MPSQWARRCVATLLLTFVAGGAVGAAPPDEAATSERPSPGEFSLVVMDPLAAPLSCPCVEGYAQRDYQQLADHLAAELGRPVNVTFAPSLKAALEKESCDHADLIIGKDSVVRADAVAARYTVTAVGRLTDKQGHTHQTGLVVVPSGDEAQTVADLKGYRILFGPAECEEKFAAPRALLSKAGVELPAPEEAEVTAACSDGACKIIEWGDTQQAAAVISSYAAPLLEGCGTIKKGDLRVVGETAPAPFITAFVTDRLSGAERKSVESSLLALSRAPKLLVALESMLGFVPLDEAYVEKYGATASPPESRLKPKAERTSASRAWPGFGGPTRDGHVTRLPQKLPDKARILWSRALARPGLGGVAATETQVVIGDRDPTNTLDVWRCYAAADGEELWTYEYPAPGQLDYDNQPRATPLIDDGRVYLLGAFGDLACVDLQTGGMLWQMNVRRAFGASAELVWGTCSSPLLVDGKLIVSPGAPAASLAALDPDTGAPVWQAPGAAHAFASPVVATLGGVRQIVAYDRESLSGFDPGTGDRLWTLEPPLPGDFNVPTPVAAGGKLLVVSENNGARLHAFDDQGRIEPEPEAMNRRLAPDMSTPIVTAGRAFCVSDKLYCLRADTLSEVWVDGHRSFASYAPLIADSRRVLAVGRGGRLLLIDAQADEYRALSELTVFDGPGAEEQLFGGPALVGSRLYLRGEDALVCVDLSDRAAL